jgi:hypothetical protein
LFACGGGQRFKCVMQGVINAQKNAPKTSQEPRKTTRTIGIPHELQKIRLSMGIFGTIVIVYF